MLQTSCALPRGRWRVASFTNRAALGSCEQRAIDRFAAKRRPFARGVHTATAIGDSVRLGEGSANRPGGQQKAGIRTTGPRRAPLRGAVLGQQSAGGGGGLERRFSLRPVPEVLRRHAEQILHGTLANSGCSGRVTRWSSSRAAVQSPTPRERHRVDVLHAQGAAQRAALLDQPEHLGDTGPSMRRPHARWPP